MALAVGKSFSDSVFAVTADVGVCSTSAARATAAMPIAACRVGWRASGVYSSGRPRKGNRRDRPRFARGFV